MQKSVLRQRNWPICWPIFVRGATRQPRSAVESGICSKVAAQLGVGSALILVRRDERFAQKGLAALARLPEEEQEVIATLILDQIAAARGWDERFTETQDQLGALVRSARAEVARGDVVFGAPSDRPVK
jgi:hypothetical protein